ncbi:MAG: hypothetical protein ACJ798_03135 [Phenylobacterium sp.]
MRPETPLILLAAGALLSGCLTTRENGSPKVETTSEANRESLKRAAEAPLRDVNLLRTKVPDALLFAMADPYSRPPHDWQCREMVALVQPLDDALGDDLDIATKDQKGMVEQGKGSALGFAAGAASDAIPFRGWVRKLTGAERHDAFVQQAITAGAVRRAYLKGLGEARGCNPPATPSHVKAGTEVPTQALKPRYPIRLPSEP